MQKETQILNYLTELFIEPKIELKYNNDVQLLVAVILSAQCTDKRVNELAPVLFEKYKNVEDFANANFDELAQMVKPCGLGNSKAKHIIDASKLIISSFGGNLPKDRDEMMTLPGVGRKTANVVCSTLYGDNVIGVDTHILRVSNRLGLCKTKNPLICERELNKKFKNNLGKLHYRMVLFGRYYCKAINPLCKTCKLQNICIYYKKERKCI